MMQHDGQPTSLKWEYDRSELAVDAIVHALGVMFAIASPVIYFCTIQPTFWTFQTLAVIVYVASLATMLCMSAAYNIWPLSPTKWLLRRLDHSAIYLLIAATYTPFFVKMPLGLTTTALFACIWIFAAVGILLKLLAPGRFDRISIILYLLLGWSALVIYQPMIEALSARTLALLAIGGILYSIGVIFHVSERLRFHNALWHSFVLLAAIFHYGAVLSISNS